MHRKAIQWASTLALAVASVMAGPISTTPAAEAPADRVVVMYFHRTQRCPTCQKMGSYAEEAVRNAYAEALKQGTVEFHYIDFQNRKNAALAEGYKVTGPALIMARVVDGKVQQFKNLEDIWTKVREKPDFIEYVQQHVEAYQK